MVVALPVIDSVSDAARELATAFESVACLPLLVTDTMVVPAGMSDACVVSLTTLPTSLCAKVPAVVVTVLGSWVQNSTIVAAFGGAVVTLLLTSAAFAGHAVALNSTELEAVASAATLL